MARLPPLHYFMEKEAAEVAIKDFNLILQEVRKEYTKVWVRYLNFVNKYQEVDSRSLSKEKIQMERQKDENNESSGSIYFEEPHTTNSIENILQKCPLDLHSNIESLNDKNIFDNVSSMPESPIFYRNDSNSRNNNSNRNIYMDSSSESTSGINNLINNNEQEISDKTNSVVTKDSTSNVPSMFLFNTPTKSTKKNISKTKNVKKKVQTKTVTPSNDLKIKNNLRTIRKEKASNKTPLQVMNNVSLTPKNNSQIDKGNNTKLNTISYNIQITQTPSSKKLRQTKLVVHKTKKTMELSNNLKSTDTTVLTKFDKSTSNQENISKQNTLFDIISTKKKETNNEHVDDNEHDESIQIKNELIYQEEHKINNSMESNDPVNISNESTSTFFSEYENNINLDQNIDSYSIDRTSLLKTKENVIKIIDLDEAAEKRIELSKNRSYRECKQNGKKQCWDYRNIPYKEENTPMDIVCISVSPDSPSSTT